MQKSDAKKKQKYLNRKFPLQKFSIVFKATKKWQNI